MSPSSALAVVQRFGSLHRVRSERFCTHHRCCPRPLMTGIVNAEDENDRMLIAILLRPIGVVKLVVDATRSGDFVVVGRRPSRPLRSTSLTFEDGRLRRSRDRAGTMGDVIPKFLCALQPNTLDELEPSVFILTVDEHSILRLDLRRSPWASGGFEGTVCTRLGRVTQLVAPPRQSHPALWCSEVLIASVGLRAVWR